MILLTQIGNMNELKQRYRRLAMQHHPDRGGDPRIFMKLNREYEQIKRRFELINRGLNDVRVGDTVFVNGTECEVTFVGREVFIAKAKGRQKRDVFYKSTGIGKFNPQYRAGVMPKRNYACS